MVKKIQRRPVRSGLQPKTETPQTESEINFKDVLTVLASGAGVIGALLWLGGRYYATGYFESLNIPVYMLNFSIGEYGEQYFGTILTLVSFVFLFLVSNVLYMLIIIAVSIVIVALIFFFNRKVNRRTRTSLVLSTSDKPSLRLPIPLIFILIVILTLFFAYNIGKSMGLGYVYAWSQAVTFSSKEPIDEIGSLQVTTNSPSIYKYSGLRLLTYNSGKYYLYNTLDEITCKPKEIYIIGDSQIISMAMFTGASFDIPFCAGPANTSYIIELVNQNQFPLSIPLR